MTQITRDIPPLRNGVSSPFARLTGGDSEDSFALLADRKRETPVVAAAATVAAVGWPEATATGNLYIEEGGTTTPRSKRSQIARIQRNIETILSQKNPSVD